MTEKEIIMLWKNGLSKEQLAKTYMRRYNHQIRIIRSTVRHRHDGKFITSYEALGYIETVLYKHIKSENS